MKLSIPAKKSNLQIQKVRSFCQKIQGCCFAIGEENYFYICQFKVKYNWIKIENTCNPFKVKKIYKSMKEHLKECIKCDPMIDHF